MALNDRLRAAVYARDKAVCAFSGLSLWVLDEGAVPWAQADWPDHIRPQSRGGLDTVENLVCASHFYNRKKSHNGRDNQYLFRSGRPTEMFYWSHGTLSNEQIAMLRQHAAITESDWYFNRALWNLIVAMDDQWVGEETTRSTSFWINSAMKRLISWRKVSAGVRSFEDRGLVTNPHEPDIKLMLALREAEIDRVRAIYRQLARHYAANATPFWRLEKARSDKVKLTIVQKALSNPLVTTPVRQALTRSAALLS